MMLDKPLVAVCFSYRPVDSFRERNARYTYAAYRQALLPLASKYAFLFVYADSFQEPPMFNRGHALNHAVKKAERLRKPDIYVFADVDMVPLEANLRAAIERTYYSSSYIVPFTRILFLNQEGTDRYLHLAALDKSLTETPELIPETWIELDFNRHSTGAINVLSRSVWEKIGCFDERFITWGYEDGAFDKTANILCGPTTWFAGPIVHLWHPRAVDRTGTGEQARCLKLCQDLYDKINTREELMETLKGRPIPKGWLPD